MMVSCATSFCSSISAPSWGSRWSPVDASRAGGVSISVFSQVGCDDAGATFGYALCALSGVKNSSKRVSDVCTPFGSAGVLFQIPPTVSIVSGGGQAVASWSIGDSAAAWTSDEYPCIGQMRLIKSPSAQQHVVTTELDSAEGLNIWTDIFEWIIKKSDRVELFTFFLNHWCMEKNLFLFPVIFTCCFFYIILQNVILVRSESLCK